MCLVWVDILGTVANLRYAILSSWIMHWGIVPKVLEIIRYLVCTLEYLRPIE